MRFLFSPYGRTNRIGYWAFWGIYFAAYFASIGVDRAIGSYDAEFNIGVVETFISLFFFWPSIAVSVRRLHDLGFSGWWLLWVSLISTAILISGVVAVAAFGIGVESYGEEYSLNETAVFANLPLVFWVVFGLAAIPYLIQTFMLLFMPGEKGENGFERKGSTVGSTDSDAPPWAGQ